MARGVWSRLIKDLTKMGRNPAKTLLQDEDMVFELQQTLRSCADSIGRDLKKGQDANMQATLAG